MFYSKSYKDYKVFDNNSLENMLIRIKNGDESLRNEFIKKYKPFILKSVYDITGQYVDDLNDEEFSVGLSAFNEAIDRYNYDKNCTFLNYSKIVMKSRIIDYKRKTNKQNKVYPISELENSAKRNYDALYFERNINELDSAEIREELILIREKLDLFKITMQDLIFFSPKHQDSKKLCIHIAKTLSGNLLEYKKFLKSKKLPKSYLVKTANVNRGTIEKNRKYIIAITLILNSNLDKIKCYIENV